MSVPVTTRPATRADASEIAVLVNIATHGLVSDAWRRDVGAAETYSPIEVGRLAVLEDGDGLNWRRATMAEVDGEIVGLLLGGREPDVADPLPADLPAYLVPIYELGNLAPGCWYVSMLAVHARWRGHGVGQALLDEADRKRAETGARGLSLVVEDVNSGARALYERAGYSVRESRPMVRFPSGGPEGKDWLLMVKD